MSQPNNLYTLLKDEPDLTITELAERLDVSDRTVRRQLDELRDEGRRIEEKRVGRKLTYSIPEEQFELEVDVHEVKLTQQQMLALAVASRASEAVLDSTPFLKELETANRKILAKLTETADLEGSINLGDEAKCWYFPDAPRVPLRPEVIATLVQGMRDTTTVEINYYSMKSGTQRWRKVDPMTFVYRDGSWLMCAWCHNNRKIRTFALADVHEARLCQVEKYAVDKTEEEKKDATRKMVFRDHSFDVEEFFRNTFYAVGGDTVTVRLLVAAPQARSFLRKHHHPTQEIEEEHPDGSITVTIRSAGLAEVRSFILGWGAGVTVLEPEELRRQLREVALEVAGKYS